MPKFRMPPLVVKMREARERKREQDEKKKEQDPFYCLTKRFDHAMRFAKRSKELDEEFSKIIMGLAEQSNEEKEITYSRITEILDMLKRINGGKYKALVSKEPFTGLINDAGGALFPSTHEFEEALTEARKTKKHISSNVASQLGQSLTNMHERISTVYKRNAKNISEIEGMLARRQAAAQK